MFTRNLFGASLVAFFFTSLLYASIVVSHAQVMQSTNYRIQSDSINFGGGFSSSTNYILESTGGEIATGESNSTQYRLKAGYQQMVTNYIAISGASSVTMTPAIVGVGGGAANGSTTVTVITDGPAGYELTISAERSPALQKGSDTFADYAPLGANPDFTFTTGASDVHFGYSPSGADTIQRFKDDSGACNTGVLETPLACWDGLDTTSEPIARSSSANNPTGATTTVYFRAEAGNSTVVFPGVYVATTTLTALSL